MAVCEQSHRDPDGRVGAVLLDPLPPVPSVAARVVDMGARR